MNKWALVLRASCLPLVLSTQAFAASADAVQVPPAPADPAADKAAAEAAAEKERVEEAARLRERERRWRAALQRQQAREQKANAPTPEAQPTEAAQGSEPALPATSEPAQIAERFDDSDLLPSIDTPSSEVLAAPALAAISTAHAAPTPQAPAAPQPSGRQWLAGPEQAPALPTESGGYSWALIGVALAGGAAYFMHQRRRKSNAGLPAFTDKIDVVSSGRIGPKAHAVAVEFGGQVLMLGVTENQVTCLHTFPKENSAEEPEVEAYEEDAPTTALVRRSSRAPFRNYLDRSLEEAPEESAAESLASNTRDRASVRRREKTLVDVEGQAAGLAARLDRQRRKVGT